MTASLYPRMRRFAVGVASIAGLAALTTLVGYITHTPLLVTLGRGLTGMAPLTALALLALTLSIVFSYYRAKRWVFAALGVAAMVALAVGNSYLLSGQDAISPLIGEHLFGMPRQAIGRTSMATASCIALLTWGIARRRISRLADTCATLVLLISGTALLGYLYGAEDLYAVPVFKTMSVHTSIALFCLGVSLLCIEPRAGFSAVIAYSGRSGSATRRQMVWLLLIPFIGLGLDWAFDQGLLREGAAMALLVVSAIAPFVWLIFRDGRILEALERAESDKARQMALAADELERRLVEQTKRLQSAHEARLSSEAALHRAQRLDAMGQLTGGIAHDFNNLLQAINGQLDLAKRRVADPVASARHLGAAKEAVQRAAKLSKKLLAFSKTQDLILQPVNAPAMLAGFRDLIASSMGPDIAIQLNVPEGECWVLSDLDQLENALVNLALNAKEAMPEGGTLTVAARNERVWSELRNEFTWFLKIRLIDTGMGMTPEVLAHAAEPFFTTRARGEGTGLGLAQVHGFIAQCGGNLEIMSEAGAGTTVEISLLLTTPPAKAAALPEPGLDKKPGRLAQPRRVMVVDDDDAVRLGLVAGLESYGYHVTEAAGGAEGLAMIGDADPEVLVVDFLMPGMNGAEVARRARLARPELPIVFVSGFSDTRSLLTVPGAAILSKPFQMEELASVVESVMR